MRRQVVALGVVLAVLMAGHTVLAQEKGGKPEAEKLAGEKAGGAAKLALGDTAPPLKVEKWLKGEAVDLKAGVGKNVYVVEFWATWCGPCRASMPHLTALQKKFKDKNVVIVAVSTDNEKSRDKVEQFIKDNNEQMGYTIALDTKERDTSKAYMDPLKIQGIPASFVIDTKGKLMWTGHPKFGLEQVIEAVLGGKYDVDSLKEVSKKEEEKFDKLLKQMDEYFQAAMETKDVKSLADKGQKLVEQIGEDSMMLNQFAWTILDDEAITARDLELALKAAKKAVELTTSKDAAILDTYARALFDTGKVKEAIEQQKKAVDLATVKEMKEELQETLEKYQKAEKK